MEKGNHPQEAAFPRHLSNCVPQNISLRCCKSSHIIRQMAMFTDCPLGSRLVSWQVELPTSHRLGGRLHTTVEASKIQIVCRRFVQMSGCPSMGLLHSNVFLMICICFSVTNHCLNVAWYESLPSSFVHVQIRFRAEVSTEVPMLWLPAGQGGELKSTCWVGQVSGICVDLSPRHERAFVSPNPWKQWKHIEK